MMEIWELSVREHVRDLIARYNANGDSGRTNEVVALFAADGVLDADGVTYTGHSGIRSLFSDAAGAISDHPRVTSIRHFTATTQVDVTGPTTARARSYYQVLMGSGLDHWGRYVDEAEEIAGRWVFTRRRETLDGAVAGGWAASTLPLDDSRIQPGPQG